MFTLHVVRLSWGGLAIAILFNVLQYTATGIREETSDRGYVFQNLGECMPLWLSVVGVGVFFVLAHLLNGPSYVTPSFIVVNLLLSTIWIYGRLLTRSLWFSISMHATLDACSFLIAILLFSGGADLNTLAARLLWLEMPFVALILLVLFVWTLWGKQYINWNARLTENGELGGQMQSFFEERGVADTVR